MRYGIPYKGSKSNIAKWVIDTLPPADVFVDLFAGGGAITHCAMLSGKYKRFIANDISGSMMIFKEAINGDFDGYANIPDRTQFFLSEDVALRILYSFGNDKSSYLWGDEYEAIKVPAERMLSAPSVHERRMYYKQFMKEMVEYVKDVIATGIEQPNNPDLIKRLHCLERLQGMTALGRLHGLERLQELNKLSNLDRIGGLDIVIADYRNVNIPKGACVYADPPYRNTTEHYGGFDFNTFDKWLNEVDFPVFISEYDAPAGCVCIAERERTDHMGKYNGNKKIEKIFVQERYASKYRKRETLFDLDNEEQEKQNERKQVQIIR